MNRSDLTARLAARSPSLNSGDCREITDTLLGAISDALIAGRRVEIRGFGSFGTRVRPGKVARNPKTGEPVLVAEKRVPFFKPGLPLLAHLQPKPPYSLKQLISECAPTAPMPADLREWEALEPVGLEVV